MTRFDCTAQLARVIWLSLIRCAASNCHTHRGFRAFLCKVSEIGDSLAERGGFELSLPSSNGW